MHCSKALQSRLIETVPSLRAFAISLCSDVDRADDLVQETIEKAWRNLDSFTEGTNLKAWLFTILRNTYFSECRKRRREVKDEDGAYSSRLSVHPEQQGHMDSVDVTAALATLGDDQREALILVAAEGFSYEEVAEICGCAIGTVKSRVSRARTRLARALQISHAGEFGPDSQTEAIIALSRRG